MGGLRKDLGGILVLIVALALGAFLLLRNSLPPTSALEATDVKASDTPAFTPTGRISDWQDVIRGEIVEVTPQPTVYVALPTLDPPTPTPAGTDLWSATPTATRYMPVQPTRPAPTAVAAAPSGPTVSRNPQVTRGEFSPPPELAPLSLDPRDHFWFRRPVSASANSSEIYWYVYGSNGPENLWRIHHGIDLPNPDGKEVHAAGDGVVIWAADNYVWAEDGWVDRAYSYGNVVIIQHDFGFEGKPLYTLYAHLSIILVEPNQRVRMGDTVGLSGRSGIVSGPHVHFEVRVEKNKYSETRNPILWMVPYNGHGVIAGRITRANGDIVQDATVKLWRDGKAIDSTTTYVNPHWMEGQSFWNVNPDEVWRENFVIGDVPAGDYWVTVEVDGIRYQQPVTVRAATTSFVDFNRDRVQPTPSG